MGIDPVTVAIVSGGLQLFSAMQASDAADRQAGEIRAGNEATKAARDAESRIAEVRNARERIEQAREARVRAASIAAATTNQGIGAGTSGVAGSLGSVRSQASSNIGFINQQESFAGEASRLLQVAADHSSNAATAGAEGAQWQQIGALAGQAFGQAGGFTTIFGGNTIKKAG